jgi:hypothetical protein
MNSNEVKKLKDLILEYSASLARIDDQKDIMKAIAARVMPEIGIEPDNFKKIAQSYHKDVMRATRDKVVAQAELFDIIIEETTL